MLEERNAKDSEKDLLIANLQSQLAYLKNKVFGSTSEIRHDQLDGQLNLFGTPVGDEKPAEVIEPEVISVKGYTKERKPKATYDDKYNSVRSICKHFFTDIVGLSIKFFCVSLRHMSISVTLEAGTNVAGLTKQGVRVHTIKKDLFEMGLSEAASPVGHTLRSYDMERTICDLVRSRRCIEAQTLQGAVKGYARSKTKNTPRLMRYAKALSIESVIRQYMEVLL